MTNPTKTNTYTFFLLQQLLNSAYSLKKKKASPLLRSGSYTKHLEKQKKNSEKKAEEKNPILVIFNVIKQ